MFGKPCALDGSSDMRVPPAIAWTHGAGGAGLPTETIVHTAAREPDGAMDYHRSRFQPKRANRMRAVRLHGIRDLRFEEIAPAAAPGPGCVQVRVQAVGVCGSDLHNFRTGRWLGRVPVVPGHEFAGEVVAIGAGVQHFAPGDTVIADSRLSCGHCAQCREGRPNTCEHMGYVGEVCDGGYAEAVTLPATSLMRAPPGVSPVIAALAEPLSVALRVVRRLAPERGHAILIAGAGPIGGLAALLLDHLGYGPLYIVERNAQRAALLAEVARVRAVEPDPVRISAHVGPGGLRYAVEASGSAMLFDLLVRSLAGGGRLAMVGIFDGHATVDASAIVERELEIRGCSVFCDEQRAALALLQPLAVKLERLISLDVKLEELPVAFERLLAGQTAALKTVVRL
jgi:(R,R)-butanediol dehydrogenase/meso-butanediol dehydrogenase/diacetyl reductase